MIKVLVHETIHALLYNMKFQIKDLKDFSYFLELSKKHGVVFVQVNYRLGVFGFLSLNSLSSRTYPKTSGNYGLGDIISALEWLKLNIHNFGGHPSQITLLGRGSGATMVTALTASAKAKSLFKQAWVTNGAGVITAKSLSQANKDNKVSNEITENAWMIRNEILLKHGK